MKPARYLPFLALSGLFLMSTTQAEMYKWTDKNGKIHYTQTPPPADIKGKNMDNDVKLSTGKLGNVIPTASTPSAKKETPEEAGKRSTEQHKAFCDDQKRILEDLTTKSLIKWKDNPNDKEGYFLNAEQKAQKKQDIQKNLDQMCSPAMFEQVQQAEERAKNNKTASEVAAQANTGSSAGANGGKTGAGNGSAGSKPMPPANSNGTISR
jgi:hypothetical protein